MHYLQCHILAHICETPKDPLILLRVILLYLCIYLAPKDSPLFMVTCMRLVLLIGPCIPYSIYICMYVVCTGMCNVYV